MKEAYVQVLNYAIPAFVLLILIEYLYGYWAKKQTQNWVDTVASLSSGITNILKDVMGLTIGIISYSFLVKHLAVFHFDKNYWYLYVLAFLGKDFAGYWIHRLEHKINVFWNRHLIHHSSEEYNLPCALRQSISEIFGYTALFLLPLAIIGVPAEVYAVVAPLHLFLQFWYHTQHIEKMGFLEKIIVTPSHHRVHHAINPIYIDKNFSQIFIVFDKIFGTYQEELPDEKPVYGIKKAVETWNPFIINFQHLFYLARDAFFTNNWADKLKIWFMPTGWRPEDVQLRFPMTIIENPAHQKKYMPEISNGVVLYAVFSLLFTIAFTLYFFNHLGDLSKFEIGFGTFFIMLTIFGYTSLMDKSFWALAAEFVRLVTIAIFFSMTSDWFLFKNYASFLPYCILIVVVLSFIYTGYETYKNYVGKLI